MGEMPCQLSVVPGGLRLPEDPMQIGNEPFPIATQENGANAFPGDGDQHLA